MLLGCLSCAVLYLISGTTPTGRESCAYAISVCHFLSKRCKSILSSTRMKRVPCNGNAVQRLNGSRTVVETE